MQVCKTYISYISPYPIGEHCEYTYSSSKYSRYLKLECRISKYYQFYSESLLFILLINFNALYFLSKFLFPQNELLNIKCLATYSAITCKQNWVTFYVTVDDSLWMKVSQCFQALSANLKRRKKEKISSYIRISNTLHTLKALIIESGVPGTERQQKITVAICSSSILAWVTMSVSAPPSRNSITTQSSSSTKKESYISTMFGWW